MKGRQVLVWQKVMKKRDQGDEEGQMKQHFSPICHVHQRNGCGMENSSHKYALQKLSTEEVHAVVKEGIKKVMKICIGGLVEVQQQSKWIVK